MADATSAMQDVVQRGHRVHRAPAWAARSPARPARRPRTTARPGSTATPRSSRPRSAIYRIDKRRRAAEPMEILGNAGSITGGTLPARICDRLHEGRPRRHAGRSTSRSRHRHQQEHRHRAADATRRPPTPTRRRDRPAPRRPRRPAAVAQRAGAAAPPRRRARRRPSAVPTPPSRGRPRPSIRRCRHRPSSASHDRRGHARARGGRMTGATADRCGARAGRESGSLLGPAPAVAARRARTPWLAWPSAVGGGPAGRRLAPVRGVLAGAARCWPCSPWPCSASAWCRSSTAGPAGWSTSRPVLARVLHATSPCCTAARTWAARARLAAWLEAVRSTASGSRRCRRWPCGLSPRRGATARGRRPPRGFFDLSAVLLAAVLAVGVALGVAAAGRRRPWDAAHLALAPVLVTAALLLLRPARRRARRPPPCWPGAAARPLLAGVLLGRGQLATPAAGRSCCSRCWRSPSGRQRRAARRSSPRGRRRGGLGRAGPGLPGCTGALGRGVAGLADGGARLRLALARAFAPGAEPAAAVRASGSRRRR